MIRELSWYVGCEKGNNIMIVGAGSGLRENLTPILHFIGSNNCVTIGINKMTHLITPDYHLWTNNQRLRDQSNCINPSSKLMLGCNIRSPLRDCFDDYIAVDYVSGKDVPHSFRAGVMYGHYRIAGVQAIGIADLLGAKNIFVVGMDGFTLHSEANLKSNEHSHHCYGSGYTDDASYNECKIKDNLTYQGLSQLADAGVNFKLITPTIHEGFYEDTMGVTNDA